MPKKHRMKVTEASSSQYFMKDPAGLLRIVDSQKTIKGERKVDAQRKRHLRFVYLRWLMSDKWKQDRLKGTKRAEGSLIEGARSGHCHLLSSIVNWNGGWSLSLPSWPRIVSIYETNSSPKYRPGSFSSRIFFFQDLFDPRFVPESTAVEPLPAELHQDSYGILSGADSIQDSYLRSWWDPYGVP